MLKTKKFRRLLAGLLAVLMLSVCLPVGAFADDGNDASAASASTTRVTFQFTDGEAFSESVLGSGIYTVGETYAADDITAAMPEGYELEDQNFTFTVKAVNSTIVVPVKAVQTEVPAETTRVTFQFSDGAAFSKSVLGSGIYTVGETYTASDITAAMPEGYELEDQNFTFTVKTANSTILVPVKAVQTEVPAETTRVTFQFSDGAAFSKSVLGSGIYTVGETYAADDITAAMPEGYELEDQNFTFTVKTVSPTILVPVKAVQTEVPAETTRVTFQFSDGATFSKSVLGSGIYTVGKTYTADDITAAMPEGFELEDQNFTFTVKTVSPTILVPVKREALKTEVAFLFTDNATFSKTVISERIYEIGGTFTADDISVPLPEGFELEDPNFTFTVTTSEPTITVPVKREALKTEVAFQFTDNATFSKTVISERIYEIGGTFTADDISVALPEGWVLDVADDWTFTVETSEPTIVVPVKAATAVAFQFTDNKSFAKTVVSDAIYVVGETYTADDISVEVPYGWMLDVADDWTFTVETAEPTIVVPVKAATAVAFQFTDNASFVETVISDCVYEVGKTYTADDISVEVPEGWMLDVADDWTFTVETVEPTIVVPVKAATAVAFQFTDNASFVETVISDCVYVIGETYTVDDISVAVPEGWELAVADDWTFTVETAEPTVVVTVKRAVHTVTIERSNGAPAILIAVDHGTNLLETLNSDDTMAKVMDGCDGYKFTGFAYHDGSAIGDQDAVTADVTVRATLETVPSTGDNTTTVTGKDEHPDIAEAKANGTWGAAPTAAPVAAATNTIPQTSDDMPVTMLIVIALVAAGAAGGLVVLRKRSHQ